MTFLNLNIDSLSRSFVFEFSIIFTFFLSLIYTIMHNRFKNHHRPATGLAISISLGLTIGLIKWMADRSYSLENLGTFAIIVIIAFIAAIIYKLIKQSGHSAIAIITVLLLLIPAIARSVSIIDYQFIFDIIFTGWILFILFLMVKYAGHNPPSSIYNKPTINTKTKPQDQIEISDNADEQINRMYRFRSLSDNIAKRLRNLRKPSELLGDKDGNSTNLIIQLQRILPEQGFLINRMADLRQKAHFIRNGHLARIKEISKLCKNIPDPQKQEISKHMIHYYYKETDFEQRLERLESLVTAAEKQNQELVNEAKTFVENHNFKEFDHIVHKAQKLQNHITHIIKIIIRTEKKLAKTAQYLIKEHTNAMY